MKNPIFFSLAALAALAALGAAAQSARADDAKAFVPTHRSTFAASAAEHNPFWPIGWVKPDVESTVGQTAAPVVPHAGDFLVSTILLNEPPMAVINGKEMAEGEVATMGVNGQAVTIQLMAVQDGQVVIRWQNQNMVVPLHRDETISRGDAVSGTTALR